VKNELQLIMIGKLSSSPGLNFINVLRTAFMLADPKCSKKTFKLAVSFGALGPTNIKAARKMLVKLTPGDLFSPLPILIGWKVKQISVVLKAYIER